MRLGGEVDLAVDEHESGLVRRVDVGVVPLEPRHLGLGPGVVVRAAHDGVPTVGAGALLTHETDETLALGPDNERGPPGKGAGAVDAAAVGGAIEDGLEASGE